MLCDGHRQEETLTTRQYFTITYSNIYIKKLNSEQKSIVQITFIILPVLGNRFV